MKQFIGGMVRARGLLAGVFVAAAVASAGQAKAETWMPVPLAKVGLHLHTDPKGVWSKAETDDVNGSGIWYGTYRSERLGGTVVVSQIVNGDCGSPSDCPVRVIFEGGSGKKVLLQSEQMCAVPTDFQIATSLKAIKACDRVLPLGKPGL